MPHALPSVSDRRLVHDRCLAQVASCDALFVWIDSYQVEGTLFEIGHAAALRKPIVLGFSRTVEPDIFWFARESALDWGCFDDARLAFTELSESLKGYFGLP